MTLPTFLTCSGLIEHFQRTVYSVAPSTLFHEIGQGSQHSQVVQPPSMSGGGGGMLIMAPVELSSPVVSGGPVVSGSTAVV